MPPLPPLVMSSPHGLGTPCVASDKADLLLSSRFESVEKNIASLLGEAAGVLGLESGAKGTLSFCDVI